MNIVHDCQESQEWHEEIIIIPTTNVINFSSPPCSVWQEIPIAAIHSTGINAIIASIVMMFIHIDAAIGNIESDYSVRA
jgi:hypothetical protein